VISKPTRFFKVGRVFKCLWTEPAGDSSEDGGAYLTPLRFGEAAFTKVRHFIVVREMQNCSLCLPLNTHNRQGALKMGLRKQDYAAVFAEGSRPVLDPMEGIVRTSFPIIVENENETIDPMSRLNFGRVYTVEHNIKVAKVGRIGQDHIKLLDDYFLESIGKLPTPSNPDAMSSHVPNSGVNLDSTSYSYLGTRLVDPSDNRYIRRTPDETVQVDASFKVRNFDYQKFFRAGRVFSTLWTDPYTDFYDPPSAIDAANMINYKDIKVHSKIRRFVVVRQGNRCCQCLPVTTYAGKGPTKKGINLNEHGLIYSGDKRPASVEGISKLPLKVKLSKGAEQLVNSSLVNYARVYTVETNVKVKDVGDLDSDSRKLLRRYYNEVNITPDDDWDGLGLPVGAVEFAGLGGSVAVTGGYQGYSAPPPLGFTPSWEATASTKPQYHVYNASNYREGTTYNQPASGWLNANSFAPSGQELYASNPLYDSQAGSTPTSTVRDTTTIAAKAYKPGSTSTSSENYQQASNYQSAQQPKDTQWILEPESGRYYINWRDECKFEVCILREPLEC